MNRRARTPVWEVYPVESYHIDLDWGGVYGAEWELLGKAAPMSTVFAVGSAVAVYSARRLESSND